MSETITNTSERPSGRDRVLLAVLAGVVLVVVALVIVLSDSRQHLAATNTRVIFSRSDLPIFPGSQRCQSGEYVPTDAASVRVFADTPAPRPQPVLFTLKGQGGRVVFRRRAAVRGGAKYLDISLPGGRPEVGLGTLCIRNVGHSVVRFAGNLRSANPAAPAAANSFGQRASNEVRTDYHRAGHDTWWAMAGPISRRSALFRANFLGAGAMWVVLFLFLAAAALSVRFLLRTFPRS